MRAVRLAFFLLPLVLTAAAPVRVLIVTGSSDEPYHHWRETTAALRDALAAAGNFDVRITEEPRGLSPEALTSYDVVLLNYNGPRLPRIAEDALENFVRSGKGLAAFHQASYGEFFGMKFLNGHWTAGPDAGWADFRHMIGAYWVPADIGHARRAIFNVDWRATTHPIARAASPSFVANDELYHKLQLEPDTEVLASAVSPIAIGGTGKREPLIWTHGFGEGRVFFTTLGHDTEAWSQPGLLQAMVTGVEWAATGEVTARPAVTPKPVRILVITGGHSYPTEFYGMLDSLPGVAWTNAATPEEAFSKPLESRYDVVLLHDMRELTSEAARVRLRAFVEAGKGVVSVHHSVVDYTDWPYWYEQVTGGKYFTKAAEGHPASEYHEGVEFEVTPADGKAGHPVLRGVGPLWVKDEAYRGMWFSPKIEVLMQTACPENDRPVVYVGPHPTARVVYVQLGHAERTMRQPHYRTLIRNAIFWTARREF
jgi:type 1 glutamine amidotransferase